MAAKRTNLTIPESLYSVAQQRMTDDHYDSFSEYVAALIRADSIATRMNETPGASTAAEPQLPVNYRDSLPKKKRSK